MTDLVCSEVHTFVSAADNEDNTSGKSNTKIATFRFSLPAGLDKDNLPIEVILA
jgi:hypothetical protein